MTRSFALSAAAAAAAVASIAEAHQYVILPAPTWNTDSRDVMYAPLAFLEDQGFATQEDFTSWRSENGYDSLRAFMDGAKYTVTDGADFTCGWTDKSGTAQAIPDGTMRSTGYTHDGPCEVWLDDTMVMQYDNCHESISGKTYDLDYSSCTSTCTLYWFWMGVRYPKNEYSWQIYKNCVPLSASARRLEGAPPNASAIFN